MCLLLRASASRKSLSKWKSASWLDLQNTDVLYWFQILDPSRKVALWSLRSLYLNYIQVFTVYMSNDSETESITKVVLEYELHVTDGLTPHLTGFFGWAVDFTGSLSSVSLFFFKPPDGVKDFWCFILGSPHLFSDTYGECWLWLPFTIP